MYIDLAVLFLGACIGTDNVSLLNEYMDGGNLEEYVCALRSRHPRKGARVPRKNCARWGIDLAQALTFLHSCNPPVIHRDLKPANLLLCRQGTLKVGDFGLSSARPRHLNGEAYMMTGRTGTIRYMAPEAMQMDAEGNSSYNEKVDCYSAAMVLWYMCVADQPFGDLDADLIMAGARSGLRPDVSCILRRHGQLMADTITKCWESNPTQRFSAEKLLECMREHLIFIDEKKKSRGGLPGASIYRWASSAAKNMFRHRLTDTHMPTSAAKNIFRHDSSKQNPHKDTCSHPVCPPVDRMHTELRGREVRGETQPTAHRRCDGPGVDSLDNTNTTTGTWSLDTTTNSLPSLDNTTNSRSLDNTTNSVRSLDNTGKTTTSVRSRCRFFYPLSTVGSLLQLLQTVDVCVCLCFCHCFFLCLCICIYIHIYIYMCVCIHTYIYTHIYIYMHTYTYIYVYIYMYTYINMNMNIKM